MSTPITVQALPGVPEVVRGDDLLDLLLAAVDRAGTHLQDGDVVCVAQKVVSKSEGAVVPHPGGDPREARRRIARRQAVRVVAENERVLVVETKHGWVCANAGVDASNLPNGSLALLPEDADASADRLRAGVLERTGLRIGVIVTDTFGRPWRAGQTDIAIGAAGITVIRDERGSTDREGRVLEVTEAAVADELAGAADLVRTKSDGSPFVLIRGADVAGDDVASALVRPPAEDLFRWGGANAVAAAFRGVEDADAFADRLPPDRTIATILARADARVERDAVAPWRWRRLNEESRDAVALHLPLGGARAWVIALQRDADGGPDPQDLIALGAGVQTVRTLAHAHGMVSRWLPRALFGEDAVPDPPPPAMEWWSTGVLVVGVQP